ncbi:membrane protein [Nocardioides baekrokdamisoli]|uniref:Membrane protein n=1 Tax=Nocardioides baekrokdamisoli TaxID=1804624 RepID=A0A3G9IU15_9ACTN|nr:DUF4395 domain-containing protein [Nocardioides baekrokdamisoli]BBH17121.1 membrane protein [Nocardioides baekrokdamisoli]
MSTQIDPRGPRFNAAVTSAVLIATLATHGTTQIVLAAIQAGLFAWGAFAGIQHTPVATVFKTVVRPRLSAPKELEDAAGPRFSQLVGFIFLAVALLAYVLGATLAGEIATGFALVAALLNAVFNFCLGCELYVILKRFQPVH